MNNKDSSKGYFKNTIIGVTVIVVGGIALVILTALLYKGCPSLQTPTPSPNPAIPRIIIEGKEAVDAHYKSLKNPNPDIPKENYQKLNDELARLKKERQTDEIKLRLSSLTMGRDAAKMALEDEVEKARKRFEQAIDTYPEVEVINLYGIYLMRIGELDDAIKQFKSVIRIGEESSRRDLVAVGYVNLGIIYKTRGDLDRAEEFHKKALKLDEELGNKQGMAEDYGNLGIIYDTRGDLDKAEEFYKKSLAITEDLGIKEVSANQYGNLGSVYYTRGDLDKAEEFYKKGLEIEEELGIKEGMAAKYGNLGNVYKTRGDLDKAEEFYKKGLEIQEELGIKEGVAIKKWNLSTLKEKQGKLNEALGLVKESRELYSQVGIKHKVERNDRSIERLQKLIDAQGGGE